MFFMLQSFSGVLGHFEAGTERSFTPSTALLLKDSGLITDVGSAAHQAWLDAQTPAAEVGPSAPEAPKLETKPAPVEPALETKPEPVAPVKVARKTKGQ